MMSAFALRKQQIGADLIEEAAADLALGRVNGNGHSAASEVPEFVPQEASEGVGSLAAVKEAKSSNSIAYPELFSPGNEENR
jgi:hypothetical protein